MTHKETAQILGVLHSVYFSGGGDQTDAARRVTINTWQKVFADEPVGIVEAAVNAFIASSTTPFFPAPGQIKEQIRLLQKGDELTEQEAWDLVMKALRNSSYGSVEEFAKLPEPVKRAVGSHNMLRQWVHYAASELQFVASEFKKAYRQIMEKQNNLEKIPAAVKLVAAGDKKNLLEG